MEKKIKNLLFVFCLVVFMILPNSVSGQMGKMSKNWGGSPEEIAELPRWCQIKMMAHYRKYTNLPKPLADEYDKWAKIVGEDIFRATHHYCAGLVMINRYKLHYSSQYQGAEQDRQFALGYAITEFEYMRERTTPKHKLYYLILMNQAYAYRESKKYANAIKNYQQISKLQPEYAEAYIEYARLLKSIEKNDDAMKILQTGLEKTKGAKSIMQEIAAMEASGAKN